MRRGREFYSRHFEEAMKLHSEGLSTKEIAEKLSISYSAVYHWTKGIRKPEVGNVNLFFDYLKKHGPMPVIEVKEKFPKHNELFLISVRRNLPIKRHMLQKRYGEYATWYYIEGHEDILETRLKELADKIKEVKDKLSSALK